MRAKFDFLKPYKLYKNLTIVFATKRKQYENSVLVYSESLDNTIKLINSRIFDPQHVWAFYMDKFFDKSVFKRTIQTERIAIYEQVKEKTGVALTPLNTGVLRLKNTYFPAYQELNRLFEIPGAKNKMAFIHNFAAANAVVMKRGSEEIYKDQYVILDGSIFGKDFGDSENLNIKGLCVGSLFYIAAKEAITKGDPSLWPLHGKKCILVEPNSGVMFVIPPSLEKLTLARFRWMLKLCYKGATNQKITDADLNEELEGEPLKAPKTVTELFMVERAVSGKTNTFPSGAKLFDSTAEAIEAYIKATYPNAACNPVEDAIVFTGDTQSADAIKAMMNKSLSLYRVKLTDETMKTVSKLKEGYKTKSSLQMEQYKNIAIKKSGDTVNGVRIFIDASEENPVLAEKKDEVIKSIPGMNNTVPLTSEQKELVYSIKDRVDEINAEAKGKTFDELMKMVNEDEKLNNLKTELKANRLQEVQNIRKAEAITQLEEKQEEAVLTINGKTIPLKDKLKELEDSNLEPETFETSAVNKEVNKAVVPALRKAYRKDLYDYDQYRIFTSFSDSSEFPIFVNSISKEDSSDAYNAKETLNVKFSIAGGAPKSLIVDIPKVDQDGFLYLQGNRKQISNQITLMPIVKVWQSGDPVVQYSTSYNKIFISRSTQVFNRKLASLKKAVAKMKEDRKLTADGALIVPGRGYRKKFPKRLNLEYEELGKFLSSYKVGDLHIDFDPKKCQEAINKPTFDKELMTEYAPEDKYNYIGTLKGKPLFSAVSGEVVALDKDGATEVAKSICDLIIESSKSSKTISEAIETNKYTGNSLMFTKLEVANAYIPLIVFLGYKEGIEKIFDAYGVEYKFLPLEKGMDRPAASAEYPEAVKFRNGYLVFKDTNPVHGLLYNGLHQLETQKHNLEDYKAGGQGFVDYFAEKLTPRYGRALDNFYVLFIDPITKDILRDKGIPNDLVGSFLYCNDLLIDSAFSRRYDINIYRIRNTECINAMLYKIVAREIESYRRTGTGTGGAFKIKRNALMEEINETANFEDSTLINPIKDCENMAKSIFKGPGAPDYQHAQGTEEHRYFDHSMTGIYGYSSSYDGNAGMNKKLSMNSSIVSKRGYLKEVDPNKVDATAIYSTGELAASFTCRHADPARSMMCVLQTGHMIPSVGMSQPLVSSGVFKAIPNIVSQDYCFKAPCAGVVKGFDSKLKNLLHLEYTDGTKGIIDMSPRYCRTPSGFFVHIEYALKHGVKAGYKFKENEVLAYDKHFFKDDPAEGIEMYKGVIAKVAACGLDQTYEDASVISQSLSEKLASEVIEQTSLGLTADSNIISIKKVGDKIKVGEPLAVFESSLESKEISSLLSKLDTDTKSALEANARNSKLSKYEGTIVDIEVFYDKPIEEYSESLQKLITSYIKSVEATNKAYSTVRPDQLVRRKDTEIAKYSKAKGVPFEGIMINFYISHLLDYSCGDKITFDVALKSIVSRIVPQNEAPISEYRPDKPIDACTSPYGIVNRMVPDVFYLGYTNKALIGLKERIEEIWNGK